jgi:hypothetical protein
MIKRNATKCQHRNVLELERDFDAKSANETPNRNEPVKKLIIH